MSVDGSRSRTCFSRSPMLNLTLNRQNREQISSSSTILVLHTSYGSEYDTESIDGEKKNALLSYTHTSLSRVTGHDALDKNQC